MGKVLPFPPPEEPHFTCPHCGSAWFSATVAFEKFGGGSWRPSTYVSQAVGDPTVGVRCLSCLATVDPNAPSHQR